MKLFKEYLILQEIMFMFPISLQIIIDMRSFYIVGVGTH